MTSGPNQTPLCISVSVGEDNSTLEENGGFIANLSKKVNLQQIRDLQRQIKFPVS